MAEVRRGRMPAGVARVAAAMVCGAAGLVAVTASPAAAAVPPCGSFITVNTVLTGDMTCPGNGLTINGSGITLDLNGHTIRGPGPDVRPAPNNIFAGVAVNPGRTDNVIKNGRIEAFTIAVTTRTSANFNEVTGLTLFNNGQGILTQTSFGGVAPFSDFNWFHDNTIDASTGANGPSVQLNGNGHRFEANRVLNGRFAGITVNGNATHVTSNTVSGHGGTAVQVNGDSARVMSNVLHANRGNGLNVSGPNATRVLGDIRIESNRVVGNGMAPNQFAAINVFSATGTSLQGNEVTGLSLGRGISIAGNASGTALTGNRLSRNTDGIFVTAGATSTSLVRNTAAENSDDGIDIDSSSAFVAGNAAIGNGDWGIEAVPGVTNGGGNIASGNGRPAQCLNIAC